MNIDYPWLFAAGIVLILFVLYWRLKDLIVLPGNWVETNGTIVNWMSREEKGQKLYHPIIEFLPEGGTKQQFRAEEHSEGKPQFPIGTKVKLKYVKSDPKRVKVTYPANH